MGDDWRAIITVSLVWKKATRGGKTKPQTATIISLRFWGLLTCAPLHCDWSLHNKPACQNEIKVFTERTWNASPPSILKNKRKAKHHILPFSGSAHHIPVHSSVFRYHSSSFRCFWAYSGTFRSVPVCGAIVAYSGITLVSFHFIAVSLRLVLVYSGTILAHSVSFWRHSASFWYIPFCSVPVFSNAQK